MDEVDAVSDGMRSGRIMDDGASAQIAAGRVVASVSDPSISISINPHPFAFILCIVPESLYRSLDDR